MKTMISGMVDFNVDIIKGATDVLKEAIDMLKKQAGSITDKIKLPFGG